MRISAGKLWSLRRLAGPDGLFTMIAVDQRPGVEALVRERGGARAGGGRIRWRRVGVGTDRSAQAGADRGTQPVRLGDAGGPAIRPALRGQVARPGEGSAG